MKTNIPAARQEIQLAISRLEAGAADLAACVGLLRAALEKMTRTPRLGRRRMVSARMTPALALAIAADVRANVGHAAYQEIGDRHGVLGARVAELIQGRYDHMLPAHLRFAERDRPGEGPRFKLTGTGP